MRDILTITVITRVHQCSLSSFSLPIPTRNGAPAYPKVVSDPIHKLPGFLERPYHKLYSVYHRSKTFFVLIDSGRLFTVQGDYYSTQTLRVLDVVFASVNS